MDKSQFKLMNQWEKSMVYSEKECRATVCSVPKEINGYLFPLSKGMMRIARKRHGVRASESLSLPGLAHTESVFFFFP